MVYELIRVLAIIFITDQLIDHIVCKFPPKIRKVLCIFAIVGLFSLLSTYWHQTKTPNFFEALEAERASPGSTLKQNFERLSSSKDSEDHIGELDLQTKFEILRSPDLRSLYDRLGPDFANLFYRNKTLITKNHADGLYNAILLREVIFYFLVAFLMMNVSSEDSLQNYRRTCNVLVAVHCMVIYYMIFSEKTKYDIFDYFFPKTAIFERLTLFKYLVGYYCIALKTIFRAHTVKRSWTIYKQMNRVLQLQTNLTPLLRTADTAEETNRRSRLKDGIKALDEELRKTSDFCERELNDTEMAPLLKKIKFGSFLGIVGGITGLYFGSHLLNKAN